MILSFWFFGSSVLLVFFGCWLNNFLQNLLTQIISNCLKPACFVLFEFSTSVRVWHCSQEPNRNGYGDGFLVASVDWFRFRANIRCFFLNPKCTQSSNICWKRNQLTIIWFKFWRLIIRLVSIQDCNYLFKHNWTHSKTNEQIQNSKNWQRKLFENVEICALFSCVTTNKQTNTHHPS